VPLTIGVLSPAGASGEIPASFEAAPGVAASGMLEPASSANVRRAQEPGRLRLSKTSSNSVSSTGASNTNHPSADAPGSIVANRAGSGGSIIRKR
jgi:hypothetical protein